MSKEQAKTAAGAKIIGMGVGSVVGSATGMLGDAADGAKEEATAAIQAAKGEGEEAA